MIKWFFFFLLSLIYSLSVCAQSHSHSHDHIHAGLHHWEIPSKDPDRIILTFNGDPSTTRAVTWRTDSSVVKAEAQIAVAGKNSTFERNAKTYIANTEEFDLGISKSNIDYFNKNIFIGQSKSCMRKYI